MTVERLRVHMAVANRGQRLYAEKEAIKEPMPAGAAGDTVWLETVKRGEEKIQGDVKRGSERGKLRPT